MKEMLNKLNKEKLSKLLQVRTKTKGKFLSIEFHETLVEIAFVESFDEDFKVLALEKKIYAFDTIKDSELIEFIQDFVRKNKIGEKNIVISVSNAKESFVKNLALPIIPDNEIIQAVKLQLRSEVDFDISRVVVDWYVIREFVDQDGIKKREYMFLVAEQGAIEKYINIVKKCRLKTSCITSNSFNFGNLLKFEAMGAQTAAILNFDSKEAVLNIYSENRLNFVRRLPISWEKINTTLKGVVDSIDGEKKLTLNKIIELRNDYGIPEKDADVTDPAISKIVSTLRPHLEALVREIRFSIDYYTSYFNHQTPEVIYLAGESLKIRNLDLYLNKKTEINVQRLSLAEAGVSEKADKSIEMVASYDEMASAIGAALSDPLSINLLRRQIKLENVEKVVRWAIQLVSAFIIIVLLFLIILNSIQVQSLSSRIKYVDSQLNKYGDVVVLNEKIQKKEGLVNDIFYRVIPVNGLLREISGIVPNEIILSVANYSPSARNLNMSGTVNIAGDNASVILTSFMQQLESSSYIEEARLVSSRKGENVHHFDLICTLPR